MADAAAARYVVEVRNALLRRELAHFLMVHRVRARRGRYRVVEHEADALGVLDLLDANLLKSARYRAAVVVAHADVRLDRDDLVRPDLVARGSAENLFSECLPHRLILLQSAAYFSAATLAFM